MEADESNSEMRLWALEVLVSNLLVMQCTTQPDPQTALELIASQMVFGADRPLPGVSDPALSDLFSSDLSDAVRRLMDMGRTQMRLYQSR